MKQRVVTLMYGTAWERYGRVFAETFGRHWPDEVELVIVTDKALPVERATQISLADVPGYTEFMERWKGDRRANGFRPKRILHRLGRRSVEVRDWRYDALDWAAQAMAPCVALDGLEDGDIFARFDADVETLKDIPKGWLDSLVGEYDVACLLRKESYPEIGFWAVRISDETRLFVRAFSDFYSSGAVFGLVEQHSGYVFDQTLSLRNLSLRVRNLNPMNERLFPWGRSPLAEFTAHHKGGKGR